MVLRLIEVAHHCGDIWFEEAVTEYQHRQAAEHQPHGETVIYRGVYRAAFRKDALLDKTGRGKHQELTYRHRYSAKDDRTAVAPVFISDITTQQWSEIYQAGIRTINLACLVIGEESCYEI